MYVSNGWPVGFCGGCGSIANTTTSQKIHDAQRQRTDDDLHRPNDPFN